MRPVYGVDCDGEGQLGIRYPSGRLPLGRSSSLGPVLLHPLRQPLSGFIRHRLALGVLLWRFLDSFLRSTSRRPPSPPMPAKDSNCLVETITFFNEES